MMPNISVGKHQLEYHWYGQPSPESTTIVFLHEGLGCVAMWRDFPQRVAAVTGLPALVYSRAGYGKSSPIELPRDISFMHHEALVVLPELLDKLAIQQAVLLGHSDGGSIALIHAGSELGHRVKALILEAPHVFVEDISISSITAAVQNYEQGSLRSSLERYHGGNTECAFRGWSGVWLNPAFRGWNIEEYLPQIRVPVLLLQGEQDEYGTLHQPEKITSSSSGDVSLIILPHCGHSPHRDKPDQTLEAVASFIRTHVTFDN
jgi:pimeloyl-ACP methyl ester carboxylesterase